MDLKEAILNDIINLEKKKVDFNDALIIGSVKWLVDNDTIRR
jgi:hypothetical protein